MATYCIITCLCETIKPLVWKHAAIAPVEHIDLSKTKREASDEILIYINSDNKLETCKEVCKPKHVTLKVYHINF